MSMVEKTAGGFKISVGGVVSVMLTIVTLSVTAGVWVGRTVPREVMEAEMKSARAERGIIEGRVSAVERGLDSTIASSREQFRSLNENIANLANEVRAINTLLRNRP